MRKTKVKRSIIAIVLVIVAIFFIAGTYARYTTVGRANAVAQVAQWAVEIKSGNTALNETTQNIDFAIESNQYVVSTKFAPAKRAVANIDLVLEGTEVAVDFGVNFDVSNLPENIRNNNNIAVSMIYNNVEYASGETITFALPNGEAFDDTNGTKTVSIVIEWTNDDTNNDADTTIGENDTVFNIPVTLTAQQHIS